MRPAIRPGLDSLSSRPRTLRDNPQRCTNDTCSRRRTSAEPRDRKEDLRMRPRRRLPTDNRRSCRGIVIKSTCAVRSTDPATGLKAVTEITSSTTSTRITAGQGPTEWARWMPTPGCLAESRVGSRRRPRVRSRARRAARVPEASRPLEVIVVQTGVTADGEHGCVPVTEAVIAGGEQNPDGQGVVELVDRFALVMAQQHPGAEGSIGGGVEDRADPNADLWGFRRGPVGRKRQRMSSPTIVLAMRISSKTS